MNQLINMPNWCNNNYAVKAATKNVLNFVNEGLKNLGMETKDNISDAIRSLWDGKNEVTMATFRPIPGTFTKYDTTNEKMRRGALDWDTKEPLFKSDDEYETYCREYDEAVKYQEETYGVVGWYDYNCLVAFGCKWDCDVALESFCIDDSKGITTILMSGDTPWYFPDLWLLYIKKRFNLNVYVSSHEEFNGFNAFGEIDNLNFLWGKEYMIENEPVRSDNTSDEEFCEAYRSFLDNLIAELHSKLIDCVNKSSVDSDITESATGISNNNKII
ncbi:MAG: hypothetical protein IJ785_01590 [Bacteroidales bacterium]|nr:hypothetical protein [Bacteroidales bacterium]